MLQEVGDSIEKKWKPTFSSTNNSDLLLPTEDSNGSFPRKIPDRWLGFSNSPHTACLFVTLKLSPSLLRLEPFSFPFRLSCHALCCNSKAKDLAKQRIHNQENNQCVHTWANRTNSSSFFFLILNFKFKNRE
jgi:hypothetical protein